MLEFIFPRRCLLCYRVPHDAWEDLCPSCVSNIHRLRLPHCTCCAKPFEAPGEYHLCGDCLKHPKAFRKLFTGGEYGGSLKDLIHLGKFSEREDVLRPLVRFLLQQDRVGFAPEDYDLLTCIPTTPRRLRQKGLHLAARLVQTLGKIYRLPVDPFGLRKVRETPLQFELNERERWKNLKGVFQTSSNFKKGIKKVLLVDDVYTTGATLHEGAMALKKAGVVVIDGLTLARGV
ncbi:MAG: hypothetical protein A3I75_04275 [Deltaproteobacteria bacterium RIFCSPLOWO2_02_FULL_50_16]|nr:MAG: hypothetical protein A3I75_04275 [Deltaproteobacteria bacterium RIFCSPLOWO2_02_FULL_50_16]OGQ66735.1 MAG: hypothetical protein A3F89_01095 [Deltaproteobacteria bacterium RIFCSPLOWO2_12_FULL_50_11]